MVKHEKNLERNKTRTLLRIPFTRLKSFDIIQRNGGYISKKVKYEAEKNADRKSVQVRDALIQAFLIYFFVQHG